MRRLCAGLCALLLTIACSEPPQKEIDVAQGAIDAARSAGADEYATAEFNAAVDALKAAHDAVAQRDYRLALSHAIDANERAKAAARQAADGKALARSQAEGAVAATATALQQLRAALKAAETARVPASEVAEARATGTRIERDLQKARALLKSERYLDAGEVVARSTADINEEIRVLNELAATKPARRRR
ncbi:MAG TPA: hypothetical protein VD833_00570 [Vicinamibacterales bacterium]|nr:hypothetical protein [Vicinamibacterales bacterium]